MSYSQDGPFFWHWFHLLCMAREACENGVVQDAQPGTNPYFPQSLVVIVFAALSVEAFINELAEMAGRAVDSNDRGRGESVRPAEVQVLAELAAALGRIEDDHGTVESKYLTASELLTGATFDRGRQPYQGFDALMRLRNDLVHPKHQDRTDDNGYVSPQPAVVRDLQRRGLTWTRGRRAGEPRGGASWLNELQTPGVAHWAYTAAATIITATAKMLPDVPMASFERMKERAVNLPAIPTVTVATSHP